MSDFVTTKLSASKIMMNFGDKGVFVVPVVVMNFGDKGVFVRIPFHPDTLIFLAFCDKCFSFFTGNTIWVHDRIET